jgi:hypothetical protein
LSKREGRRFAFTVGAAFLVLGSLVHWRGAAVLSVGFAALGAALLLAGLLVPQKLGGVQRAWMGLAHTLSRITAPVFMSLVFYLAILPVGLATRVVGYRPLVRRGTSSGWWVERTANQRRSDLRRQF